MSRARAMVVAAALGALALGSCSDDSGDEEPAPIRGAPKQVADVVSRLEALVRARRYGAVCDELFTRSARRRAGAEDCEELARASLGDVRRPDIRLLSIAVEGERARARVHTRSAGKAPADETIVLVREGGRFRIDALAE